MNASTEEMEEKEETKPKSPQEWADIWKAEFQAAKPQWKKFIAAGEKVIKKFLDEGRRDTEQTTERLNLFHANISTLTAMLYGQLPKVEVDRTFNDQNDNVARVAGQILERICNQDIQNAGDDYGTILRAALQDRLLPGLGDARIKYDYRSHMQPVPAIVDPLTGIEQAPATEQEVLDDEWVDTVYTHWKDYLWSPARTHNEIRWKAWRSYMTEEQLEKRFPDIDVENIPMSSKGPLNSQTSTDKDQKNVNPQAEVWEIWDKSTNKSFWYVENFPKILGMEDDPLELEQFWPDPPPMVANLTTSKYMPKSDYAIAQDLYEAIDVLETRIARLTDACKLVGVYDKKNDDIKRLFQEGIENQLIPVDNWAMFAEQGGLEGCIEWLPIEAVVNTIDKLTELQATKVQQLYEVSGMSDILRGAAAQPYASATEQKIKAQFASIRVQALQDEFARWASNIQSMKCEVICKHYDPQTIIKQSGIMNTPDAQYAEQAVQLLKDWGSLKWRIIVRPESLALADYQQMKQDRTEFLTALATFLQSSAGIIEQAPAMAPYLLQMLQWGMSGFKGSNQIEGVLDQAIDEFKKDLEAKKSQPQPPSPEQVKANMALQLGQQEMAQSAQEHQQKMQAEQQKQAMELERAAAAHKAEMEKIERQRQLDQQKFENDMELEKAKLIANLAKLSAQQKADVESQAIDMISETEKTAAKARADTAVMTHGAAVDMAKETHAAETQKEVTSHAAKVQVQSGDKGDGGSGGAD